MEALSDNSHSETRERRKQKRNKIQTYKFVEYKWENSGKTDDK